MYAPAIPAAPTLAGAVRAAVGDFWAHSWRLVAPNTAWGAGLVLLLIATTITPVAWLLTPLLALPAAGTFRVAALIVRDEPVAMADGFTAWGSFGARAVVVGVSLLASTLIFTVNVVTGLEARGVLGWSLATLAGWGWAATAVLGAIVWPLLVDPQRSNAGLAATARLAALLALAHPFRFGALALFLLILIALSTLAVVVVLTLSVGFGALVACHYVLPAADRFTSGTSGG